MCGIAGLLSFEKNGDAPRFQASVRNMTGLMARRGPDGEGFWHDQENRVHFGFRRLSILDLSSAGHQPMISASGRSAIIFNGEIYNFKELRAELESHGLRFRSKTDTEVLLEAMELWGESAIAKLNGMFAFAWYSIPDKKLVLARDHAGIKPLYYSLHPGKGLVFASQYNALFRSPWGQPGGLRGDVLHLYLKLQYVPAPYGLFENTFQLEPGCFLSVDAEGRMEKKTWWSLPYQDEPGLTGVKAVDALETALDNAVRRQRISDVPLGVFLSGGVDSPLITAVARRQAGPSLSAFTIANPGWNQDEGEEAARYAKILDVRHYSEETDEEVVLQMFREVAVAQHEPLADFSILPTLLVSRLARRRVTVALSGDGGDELFFGYERPRSLLKNGEDFRYPRLLRMGMYAAGRYLGFPRKSDVIVFRSPGDYYFEVNSRMMESDIRAVAPGLPPVPEDFLLYEFSGKPGWKNLACFAREVEFRGQLQRILKKVDMASMHNSLEARVPMLDREVIETSFRINLFENLKNSGTKDVLKTTLQRYLPEKKVWPAKRGFSFPLGRMLRGKPRAAVEETLLNGTFLNSEFFNRKGLESFWAQHSSGRQDNKWGVWSLLSLQWWAENNGVAR